MIKHYESLGIDPKTKTLLFSDSLDFDKADQLFHHFHNRVNVLSGSALTSAMTQTYQH